MQRKVWIDYAKAIGITTVVMGHSVYTNPHIVDVIFLFHMPLFFFISGYLFNAKKSLSDITRSNVKTLLVPYILFNLILLGINIAQACAKLMLTGVNSFQENVFEPAWNTLLGFGGNLPVGTTWFLLALIWCKYIQWTLVNGKRWQSTLMVMGVIGVLAVYYKIGHAFPYCIETGCAGAFPFAVGYAFRRWGEKIENQKKWCYLLSMLAGVAMLTVSYHYGADVNYLAANFGGVLGVCATIGGILSIFSIGKLLENYPNKVIMQVSSASILIMCMHQFVSRDVNHIFHYNEHLWLTFAGDLGNVALLTLLYPVVKKYWPALIGNRK